MIWNKYTIQTTTEAVDFISSLLYDLGIEGIEIADHVPLSEEDNRKMFNDILPELEADDGTAQIHFYLDTAVSKEDEMLILENIRESMQRLTQYVDIGTAAITQTTSDEDEWLDKWKEHYKTFQIADAVWIKPSWEEEISSTDGSVVCMGVRNGYHNEKDNLISKSDRKDIVIKLDPGRAFGTGTHETTKLCVEALKKYLKSGSTVLDIGCGSGILSIASLKFGAARVDGIDIDKTAVDVSKENAGCNQYNQEKAIFHEMDVINNKEDREMVIKNNAGGYDLVIANILAEVIIVLAPIVKDFMKQNAYFISSGIMDTKAEDVKKALLSEGFRIIDTLSMGEWVSYVAIYQEN